MLRAARVPRARVCLLDALTLTHAWWLSSTAGHVDLLTHTADPPGRIVLSSRYRALRVVHVEISRARCRNNFKTRPHRAQRAPLTLTHVSVSAARTCIRHRSNVRDKWVVLYGYTVHRRELQLWRLLHDISLSLRRGIPPGSARIIAQWRPRPRR